MTADRTDHGSSRAWRRLRADWAARLPVPCSVCQLPVLPAQAWHLDHVTPRKHGGREAWPAHAACNLGKGARPVTGRVYIDPTLDKA